MQNFSVTIPMTAHALTALSRFAAELAAGGSDTAQPVRTFEVVTPTQAPAVVEADDADDQPTDGTGLDSQGIPWDARIHASTKTKLQDGSWKIRRNLDPKTVAEVLDELKGRKGDPVQSDVPPPPVAQAATIVAPPPAAAVEVTPPPVAQAAAVVAPPPADKPAATPGTFAAAMQLLAKTAELGRFSQPDAVSWLASQGVPNLAGLATNAAVRADFIALLNSILES